MDNLIERYVYDVTHRLPEKDRDEVSKELKFNIYDMLSDNADENEIKTVLYELGSPSSLAEKYQQKPRYLISPAVYDEYVRVLKWVVPLVGTVALVVGMIIGAIDTAGNDMADISHVISKSISDGISLGFSAAFQALVWTTIGFVIAERTGTKADKSKDSEWKIEDLPEVPSNNKSRIPLSDSITELIVIVVFTVAAILWCSGHLPFAFIIQNGNTQVTRLFSSSFSAIFIPAIAVIALFGICECIIKIMKRRWTPFVCGTVIVSNLVSMGIMLYLINRPDVFSEEFTALVSANDSRLQNLLRFGGTSVSNTNIILILGAFIVVCSLAACGTAIYKTIKTGIVKK